MTVTSFKVESNSKSPRKLVGWLNRLRFNVPLDSGYITDNFRDNIFRPKSLLTETNGVKALKAGG